MTNDDEPTDLQIMLRVLQSNINMSHLYLKYIAETHKAGKSLEYALPAIELQIESLDNLAGPADMRMAVDMVNDALHHIKEHH